MRFAPYEQLGDRPNVIVDGSGTPSTVLTLSHWPGSHVTPSLAADLSAEIVIRYLEQPEQHVAVELVSNNHFDEDGLMGVWALVEPDAALRHKELVVDVARAGDFAWSRTRDAARIAFTVGAMLDARPLTGEYAAYCARLYAELLPVVPALLTDTNSFRDAWTDEDAFLRDSDAAIDRGDVTIVEHPALDLAVVTLPAMPRRPFHRFAQQREGELHPMAVFNRTLMSRVAYICERTYSVELRYESVVQFVSRKLLPRPDLGILADRLNELERSGDEWYFESVGGLTPHLRQRASGGSSLTPNAFVDELLAFLPDAASAWDPWTEAGFR